MKSVACFSAAAAFAVFYFISELIMRRPFAPGLLPAILLLLIGFLFRKSEKKKEARRIAEEKFAAEAAARKADAENRLAEADARRAQEEADRKARIALWKETHATIQCKIAGVTHKNDDGSSRQKYLKAIYEEQHGDDCLSGDVSLEFYDYNGEQAIHVFYDNHCIGNIPRGDVASIVAVYQKITSLDADIDSFINEDDELIYYGTVSVTYSKEQEADG